MMMYMVLYIWLKFETGVFNNTRITTNGQFVYGFGMFAKSILIPYTLVHTTSTTPFFCDYFLFPILLRINANIPIPMH